jgi:hypothetical protein
MFGATRSIARTRWVAAGHLGEEDRHFEPLLYVASAVSNLPVPYQVATYRSVPVPVYTPEQDYRYWGTVPSFPLPRRTISHHIPAFGPKQTLASFSVLRAQGGRWGTTTLSKQCHGSSSETPKPPLSGFFFEKSPNVAP